MTSIEVPPNPLVGEPAFTVGGRPFFWEDVLLAGLVRGDWTLLERDLRHGLASVARARTDGALPGTEEVRAAAATFRYERNLISAQEANDWLARWKVRPEEWTDYLCRALLRARWPDAATIACPFPLADPELDIARHAEAVCSGALERNARELAERAACTVSGKLASVEAGGAPLLGDSTSREVANPFAASDALLAAAERLGISRARSRERLELLGCVERSYHALRHRLFTARAVCGEIHAHQLEWTRVACDSIAFETEAAAREALLCVRSDGQSLRELAMAAQLRSTRQLYFLDQLPPAVSDRLAGARAGDAFGPVMTDGAFVVLQVDRKIPPTDDDAEIIHRAECSLFSRVMQRELSTVVQWQNAL